MEYWEPNQPVEGCINGNELILQSSIQSSKGFKCEMSAVINLELKNNCIGVDKVIKEDCSTLISQLLDTVVIHKISEINKIKPESKYVVITGSDISIDDYNLYLECLDDYNIIFVDSELADMIEYYDLESEFIEDITINDWNYVQD